MKTLSVTNAKPLKEQEHFADCFFLPKLQTESL
jgi:hypothetical protein